MSDAKREPGALGFKLAGIDVIIKPSFWIVSAVLGGLGRRPETVLVWVVVVLVSVLIHELGHAIAAKRFALSPRIELHAMGGTTHVGEGARLSFGRTLVFVLAGPTVGVIAGVLALMARRATEAVEMHPLLDVAFRDFVWVNCGYGLLNYLPIVPLDGGLAMQAIVERVRGRRSPTVVAGISLAAIGGLAVLAFARGQTWALFMLAWLASSHSRPLIARWNAQRDRALEPRFEELDRAVSLGEIDRALAIARSVSRDARTDATRARIAIRAARIHLDRRDGTMAQAVLDALPLGWRASAALEAEVQIANGRDADAVATIRTALAETNDAHMIDALVTLLARAGALDEAFERAMDPARSVGHTALHAVDVALFTAGDFRRAAQVAERAFERFGTAMDAYNAACSYARLNESDRALAALERAVAAGYRNSAELAADDDLAALRERTEFRALVERMAG